MPLTRTADNKLLSPTNEKECEEYSVSTLEATPYTTLVRFLASVCDEIAKGRNVYVTIGSTKKGDALTVTLNNEGDRQSIFASTLADLSQECQGFLAPF